MKRLIFCLLSLALAAALLCFLPLCSLPPKTDEDRDHWEYAKSVTIGAAVVGGLVIAMVIVGLRLRRELPK